MISRLFIGANIVFFEMSLGDSFQEEQTRKSNKLSNRIHSIENHVQKSAESNSKHNRQDDLYGNRSSPCFAKSCNLYCSHDTPSPRKSALRKTSKIPILVFNTWPNPRLSHCIEDDDDEHWLSVQKADKKLQCITCSATCMQQNMRELRHDYEELENSTSHLLAEAQHLVADLRDVRNLEIILQLQNGNLDNLSLLQWPFSAMTHKSASSNTNLIV